jgi:hypothetical protein
MKRKYIQIFSLNCLIILILACGQAVLPGGPTRPPRPTADATASAELQALTQYAQVVGPFLQEAGPAAERDSAILQSYETDPLAICGSGWLNPHPTLVADAALMHNIAAQLGQLTPPEIAAETVHIPLTNSATLWAEALDNINQSCTTDVAVSRNLLQAGALLQLSGAVLNFSGAHHAFWKLVVENGLEALGIPTPMPTPLAAAQPN